MPSQPILSAASAGVNEADRLTRPSALAGANETAGLASPRRQSAALGDSAIAPVAAKLPPASPCSFPASGPAAPQTPPAGCGTSSGRAGQLAAAHRAGADEADGLAGQRRLRNLEVPGTSSVRLGEKRRCSPPGWGVFSRASGNGRRLHARARTPRISAAAHMAG